MQVNGNKKAATSRICKKGATGDMSMAQQLQASMSEVSRPGPGICIVSPHTANLLVGKCRPDINEVDVGEIALVMV